MLENQLYLMLWQKIMRQKRQNFPFCTIEPNIGMVNVNDERLEKIRVAVNGQKVIPATCEFIDIAGIVEGASKWEGLGNKFLANIREADAILQVVRVFQNDDIIHVSGNVRSKKRYWSD